MRVLVDTSVLVRLREQDNPLRWVCEQSIRQLRQQQHEMCLCTQMLIEFWSVATRPVEANGLGMSPEQAFEDCERFLRLATFLPEPEDIFDRWLHIVRQYAVKGKQVHNARLVAVAQAYGVGQILILNAQNFARYPEVSALLPQQIVAG